MIKAYPHFHTRKLHSLDGLWDFVFLGKMDADQIDVRTLTFPERMPVPAAFDAMPAYTGKRGVAVYRTRVRLSPGATALLQFEAVSMWSRVYVDGKALHEHGCGFSGFNVVLPPSEDAIREIAVVVDNRYNLERIPLHEPYFDFYQWGGIIRSVWLHEVPATYISTVHVSVVDVEAGKISVHVSLGGAAAPQMQAQVEIDRQTVLSQNFSVQQNQFEFQLQTPDPTPWSPEHPNLHHLRLSIPADDMIVRFGLRQVTTRDRQILLNGSPLKLLGYNRHESHPQFGPATPFALMVSDLEQLQDLGCNFIRGSHYQQDQRFLDLCDEFGILVWEESLGWQQEIRHFTNLDYLAAHYAQVEDMVKDSYNHPSVIIWGFMNEAHTEAPESRPVFEKTFQIIKALDASRLVTYATCRLKEDRCLDLADIVCLNIYPGWYPGWGETFDEEDPLRLIVPAMRGCMAYVDENGFNDRAIIFSEIGAEGLYGWHDSHEGYWSEDYQAKFLSEVCGEVQNNLRISGLALWHFSDARSYGGHYSIRRARTFNNKGTLDEYRRPKLAYQVVKKWFKRA